MRNIFEKATKEKIRFEYKGFLTVEDLWDLSLTDLNEIYKSLVKQKKSASEESLLDKETTKDVLLNTQIKLVKHIFDEKEAEKERAKQAIDRKERKEKIMSIIAKKQDSELEEKSSEELKDMLNEL